MKNKPRTFTKLITGIFIFAGLPLIGWGLGDIQGFFSHTARSGYILITILLHAAVVFFYPEIGSHQGVGKNTVQRQHIALVLIQLLSLAIVLSAPFCDRRDSGTINNNEILRYAGLILFVSGSILMAWAEIALGKLFSVEVTIQEEHRLITRGPYLFLRHPRYLGIILFSTGISFIFRSWFSLILALLLTIVLIWRIRDEETLLCHEFGKEWEKYSQKSWRLIPFVY